MASYGDQRSLQAPATGRETIQDELSGQGKELECLHNAISDLEERLGPVLQEAPSPSASKDTAPVPPGILYYVREHTRNLSAASSRIHGLIERLQL